MPIFTDSGIQMAFLLVQSAARLMRLDRSRTIWEKYSHIKRENKTEAFRVEAYQTAGIDDEPLPEEGPRPIGGSDVASESSTAAICARIRWLAESHFGSHKGFQKEFSEATSIDYDRVRSILKGAQAPSRNDLRVIKRFFGVDADFLLYGEVDGLRHEVSMSVQGSASLRAKLLESDVDLPEYLR